ncbi:hypothetical protein D5281_18790 [bacterium 1xD42-62]|uniref:Uncharacterized protein n=2 Tax=Parablautia muri TaxID=2320879 RepID=A0A9X5BKB3_9FIRM|nr:hypothetical protein [Parablautia muri]
MKTTASQMKNIAMKKIGDDAIDDIFESVSAAIGDTVWEKFGEFIVRQHLDDQLAVCNELFDRIKRDMAWACVEKVLDTPIFFTMLAEIYKEGYFPCSWNGECPSGRILFFDKFLLNISKKCNRQIFFPSIWMRGYQYEKKGGSNGGLRDNLSVLET